MNRIVACFLFLLWSLVISAQKKGVVISFDGMPIDAVQIKNVSTGKGTVSDSSGYFYIKAIEGELVEFQHLNYSSRYIPFVALGLDTVVLQKKDFSIDEVSVHSQLYAGYDKLNSVGIKRIPAFMGEQDIIKYLSTLPGVTSLGMLDAGIYVRGGNSSQNAYLVNGVPVADPQHIAGVMSIFDPYILSNTKFYKSGYPSKYNGYLSSYVDMQPASYMSEDFTAEISVGILASSVKAKIKPDKEKNALLAIGFRQSYFQLLAKGYNKNMESDQHLPSYAFNDLTVSYYLPLKNKWEASLFTLVTSDHLPMNVSGGFKYGLGWGTFSNALSFKGSLSGRSKAMFAVGYNRYKSDVELGMALSSRSVNETAQCIMNAEIQTAISSMLNLNYGASASLKKYNYNQEIESLTQNVFSNHLMHAFTEGQLRLGTNLRMSAGLNVSSYLNTDTQVFLSPRFKVNYGDTYLSAWLDYAHSLQFEERMNIFTVQSPVDIWLPVKDQSPSQCHQVSVGAKWQMNSKASFTLGAFYKRLDRIKEFESFNRNDYSQSIGNMLSGTGSSVGAEFDFVYSTSRAYSRVNYTLSHVKVRFGDINQGEYFNPPYDVRHNILWNTSFKMSKCMNINVMWTYKSGLTATVPVGVALVKDIADSQSEFIPVYEDRYNYIMPATHRLDLNVEYVKNMGRNMLKLNMGAYNLYNQQNPSFVFVDGEAKDDYFIQFKLNSKVIFPLLPYFTLSYVFTRAKN